MHSLTPMENERAPRRPLGLANRARFSVQHDDETKRTEVINLAITTSVVSSLHSSTFPPYLFPSVTLLSSLFSLSKATINGVDESSAN